MKNKLISNLEKLRKSKIIQSYELQSFEEQDGKRPEAVVKVRINDETIVNRSLGYNQEYQKFGKVSDVLLDDIEDQLLQAGIMSLYANRTQVSN